jgi:hypothetical protein
MTGVERPEPVDVEICPECGGTNIGGRKNCYGPPDAKHDPVRFEFRQFLPASYADDLHQRALALAQALAEAETELDAAGCQRAASNAHQAWREHGAALTPPTSERTE